MTKQAVIFRIDDKPVACCAITTFQSAEDFVKFEKECFRNFQEFIQMYENRNQELFSRIVELNKKIKKLEAEVKYIKGEITEEEYTKLIGEGK